MNDRVAQWRKRCLNSSVLRIARRRRSSRFLLVTSFVRPLSSMRRGTVTMKLSSVTLTRTFVWWASVMANAKARLSASFTRRPNGKWKMTFRFPLTSRYPSRRTWRSVGRDGINASCSWTYETRDWAEPVSTWYSFINHSFAAFSPSLAISPARSRRNSPTAIERSNERGNISPVHEGTVGRRPDASFTYTDVPRARTNWYVRPPKTKMSLGLRYSTNFSLSSPSGEPRSEKTWYVPSSGIVPTFV